MTSGTGRDCASPEALAQALGKLTDADLARLYQLARNRAKYLYNVDSKDLLHMAIVRALEGTRPWPADVPLIAFLAEVMRSIADDYKDRQIRRARDPEFDDDDIAAVDQRNAQPVPVPDGACYSRQVLDAAEKFFANDEEAWVILTARAEGYGPTQIQTELGLTPAQYEAASKRLQRNLPRLRVQLEGGGG